MEIRLARTAGFCMGVKRAVDKALAVSEEEDGPIHSLGPLIHNQQVVDLLVSRGVAVCEDLDALDGGTVVIRAHGVPPDTIRKLEEAGLDIEDATCPHVLSSQRAIRKYSSETCQVVIAGDKDHAESIGLKGYCAGPGVIISTVQEAERIELGAEVCLIAQTTFNEATYERISGIIRRRRPSATVLSTICKATQRRQDECRALAAEVNAMVVVGGQNSANTRRLAEIARSTDTPTFHIETAEDLDASALSGFETVGVTAGASTPNWIIRSVIRRLEQIGQRRTVGSLLWRGVEALTQSSIYAGLGAMGLTYACYRLQHERLAAGTGWFLLISFCYIFSVHICHRMGHQTGQPSPTSRLAFFARHAKFLSTLSILLAAGSLGVAAMQGPWTLVLLAAAYAIGIVYNVRLVPAKLTWLPYRRLKDLPASKDVFSAAAWASVAVVLPSMPHTDASAVNIAGGFVIAFTAAFIRATLLDFTDIQADRMTGRDTLPTLIGSRKTIATLVAMTGVMAGMLLITATVYSRPLGYWLLAVPAFVIAYLHALRKRTVPNESVSLLAADGTLVLMGLVALAWAWASGV